MRPRSFERGKSSSWSRATRTSTRFNEAALFRTRKVSPSPVFVPNDPGFNEAALFRTRKGNSTDIHPIVKQTASMRPRSFERGKVLLAVNGPMTLVLQ